MTTPPSRSPRSWARERDADPGVLAPREPLTSSTTTSAESGRGNEKGHVENHVGYSPAQPLGARPVVRVVRGAERVPGRCCYADLFRRVRGKVGTKAERLVDDRAAMLALPAEAFEPRRVAQGHANSLSLVRFDRNDYSVPTAFAHHEVTVIGGIEEVAITLRDRRDRPPPAALGQGAHHL